MVCVENQLLEFAAMTTYGNVVSCRRHTVFEVIAAIDVSLFLTFADFDLGLANQI